MRNTETKRQIHSPSEKAAIPQSSPGLSSEFRTRKGEKSPTASAALGRRKESPARACAQPPTHFNAAGHLGHLGASRPSRIPNQCAPAHPARTHLQSRCPRRRRAHSAGATGRTAARREEPCGCGPGGRRAPLLFFPPLAPRLEERKHHVHMPTSRFSQVMTHVLFNVLFWLNYLSRDTSFQAFHASQ